MAFSRRLGVIGILGACWFVAVGCSDDEDQKDSSADGGDGGEAPSAGKSAVAGSSNNAGKSGGGGKAGASAGGAGGVATGGAGGETPSTAGAGGADGGSGGAAGAAEVPGAGAGGASGASGADAGGAAGAGGDAGVAVAKACADECEIDADCAIQDAFGRACNQATHRCYDASVETCTTNDDCLPSGSQWFVNCETDDDCADDGSESCVGLAGVGYCAVLSVAGECSFSEPKDMPRFGAQGTSNVCVGFDRCNAGACIFNCADPLFGGFCDVGNGNGDTCNPTTGLCECALPSECNSGVCGADAHCAECALDSDCAGAQIGRDVCVAGKCGCSAASVCPDLTAEATPVCE